MSADQLRQAYELIRQGQKEEAVVLLQPILRSDRNNADAWWLMANALTDPAKQVQALNEVLRLRPNDARAEKMLGRVQIDMQSKQNDFSFAVSDDDPFSSTSQSSSFSSASSSQDDPYSTSGSDPFSQSAGEKPKRGTAMPPPVYQQQRSGRNPLVTCLAIIGILTLGCCLFTVFVVPRIAVPVIEQIASQFPDIMETLTYDPNFQGMFATLEAGGGLSFGTLTSSGTFDRSEARDRGKIELGRSITGGVDTFDDDYYTLTVTGRQEVTINVAASTNDLDPQLYVYDASNQLVGENDDIDMGTNNDSRLTLTVSPGIYYVVVSAFGTGGEYTINLSN